MTAGLSDLLFGIGIGGSFVYGLTRTFARMRGGKIAEEERQTKRCGGLVELAEENARREDMKCFAAEALLLCWAIEKLPASEQQTRCSVMASELQRKLNIGKWSQ